MNNSSVSISADDMGNVVRVSGNNSDYGFIRLTQSRTVLGNGVNNFVKTSNLSTILLGKVDDLVGLNFKSTDKIPGRIIIKESLTPFSSNDPDRDLKVAGETGIVCSVNGQPIYRKTFFVGNVSAEDVLVAHDNGNAISVANGNSEAKVNTKVTTAEAFGIGETEQVEELVEAEETFDL